jgi:hypothetical protein
MTRLCGPEAPYIAEAAARVSCGWIAKEAPWSGDFYGLL